MRKFFIFTNGEFSMNTEKLENTVIYQCLALIILDDIR
ncbi:MAG: hypothetical protein ACJA04_000405 [Cellvibrionaceae bacterium]|jgi:hypothetical protein